MASFFGLLLDSLAFLLVCVIGFYLIPVIAYWRIFTKAGEPGWKSLVPFYNLYIQYKITWNTSMFWVFLAGVLASSYLSGTGGIVTTIAYVIFVAACAVGILSWHKLSLAFGHGIGFTLGLIFLSPIFILILGFGSDQYQGPQ